MIEDLMKLYTACSEEEKTAFAKILNEVLKNPEATADQIVEKITPQELHNGSVVVDSKKGVKHLGILSVEEFKKFISPCKMEPYGVFCTLSKYYTLEANIEEIKTSSEIIIPPHEFVLCAPQQTLALPPDVYAKIFSNDFYLERGILSSLPVIKNNGYTGTFMITLFNCNKSKEVILQEGDPCCFVQFVRF